MSVFLSYVSHYNKLLNLTRVLQIPLLIVMSDRSGSNLRIHYLLLASEVRSACGTEPFNMWDLFLTPGR